MGWTCLECLAILSKLLKTKMDLAVRSRLVAPQPNQKRNRMIRGAASTNANNINRRHTRGKPE